MAFPFYTRQLGRIKQSVIKDVETCKKNRIDNSCCLGREEFQHIVQAIIYVASSIIYRLISSSINDCQYVKNNKFYFSMINCIVACYLISKMRWAARAKPVALVK